jgi:hypothetical protein
MADLLASSPGSGRRDGIYPESMFRYQPQSDTFLCPAGQVMKPRRLHSVRLTWEYVTKRGVCLNCRLREFCTRSIKRDFTLSAPDWIEVTVQGTKSDPSGINTGHKVKRRLSQLH